MNPTVFGNASSNQPTTTNLQNRAFFQSQPQLHSGGPTGQQSGQASESDNNEKTPLLFRPS